MDQRPDARACSCPAAGAKCLSFLAVFGPAAARAGRPGACRQGCEARAKATAATGNGRAESPPSGWNQPKAIKFEVRTRPCGVSALDLEAAARNEKHSPLKPVAPSC